MKKTFGLINVNLRWFMLAMILANIAGQMAYSMLSLYMIDLGASVSQVGLVFTVASLVPMILQIFGGWLSDSIGRLKAIAIGSSIAVFGYLMFFLSPSWEWVMLGLCVEYTSNSFVGPSFSAYIAEQSDENVRGKVYGLTRAIYMVVTVIGPALAGLLAFRYSFKWMLVLAFILYALATLVRVWMATAERFLPVTAIRKPSWAGFRTDLKAIFAVLFAGGILTWIWITDAIGDTSFGLISELFPIYMADIGHLTIQQIGFLGSAWGLASIAGSLVGGWLTDRLSERKIISAGFLGVTIGLASIVISRSPLMFFAGRVINGLGVGLLMPAYDSLISKVVPVEKRGLAFGFFGTSLSLLALPMPWLGALAWEKIAPQAPFIITCSLCAIIIPIIWAKFHLSPSESTS